MTTAPVGATKENETVPIGVDVSEGGSITTRTATMESSNTGSGNEQDGLLPPGGNDAHTPKATNGARSASPSTAREESTPAPDMSNRRRSGRVIKKPKKFLDEIPAPSAPAKRKRAVPEQVEGDEEMQDASGGDNESNGEDDEDEGEEDSEDSSEEDHTNEEELREKRRLSRAKGAGRKTAATKVKVPAVKKAKTASGAIPIPKRTRKPTSANGTGPRFAAGRKGRVKQRPLGSAAGPSTNNENSILFGKLTSKYRDFFKTTINGMLDAAMSADNLSKVASDWISKYQEHGPEAMKQLVNFFLRVSTSFFT